MPPDDAAPTAVCTIASGNYLAHVRALADSFRRHHPELPFYFLLVDRLADFHPEEEPFHTIHLEELPIKDLAGFCFQYTCLELNTAVKPFLLEYLFARFGHQQLFYFDPDIKLYHSVSPLIAALDEASVVLLPHLTASLPDGAQPDDLEIMRSGSYNLGFLGLSRDDTTASLLKWWQGKLYKQCVVDHSAGYFVDQRWMDLAPGMFPGVRIIRDPGYDVAYWNLAHRRLQGEEGRYLVNGEPLRFYHFSGFDSRDKEGISKHQNRYRLSEVPCLRELFADYEADLLRHGHQSVRNLPYAFATFADGTPIPGVVRQIYRTFPYDAERFGDPFAVGPGTFHDWLASPADGNRQARPVITRLAYEIYRRRADLQQAFPQVFGRDRLGFAQWVAADAAITYELPRALVQALQIPAPSLHTPAPSLPKAAAAPAPPGPARVKSLRARGVMLATRLGLGKVAHRVLGSRAAALRDRLMWGGGGLRGGVRARTTRLLAKAGVGKLARRVLGHSLATALRDRVRWGRQPAALPAAPPPPPTLRRADARSRAAGPLGANVVGFLRSESGVGEAARAIVRALVAAGVPVTGVPADAFCGHRQLDASCADLAEGNPYPTNVIYLGADVTPATLTQLGQDFYQSKYNIGCWAWELDQFPPEWLGAFDYVDEVWVPSGFVQDCVSRVSPVPVMRMPHAIEVKDLAEPGPEVWPIPAGQFVFLFMFDYHSFPERKHPLGLLQAFQRAFSARDNVHLVLKGTDSRRNPGYHQRLLAEARPGQVTIIDRYLDRPVINGLLQRCDCYVSLHRSEGFGLTMAEAMYLGKPVIATGYSGNLDFMHPDNSYLVPYRLIEIDQDYGPYRKGWQWADPDLEAAAELMRRVYEQPEQAARVAARGREEMLRHYSPAAVGALARARLELLRGPGRP